MFFKYCTYVILHIYMLCLQAMTSINDLDPAERKRQREALRRRLAGPGLRPGLLAKWQQTHTTQGKWEFLKAFLLDPQNLSGVTVETEYQDLEEQKDQSSWVELPLETLRKQFTSDAEKTFLQKSVIDKQTGRDHPQDPTNPDMRLYWIYQEGKNTSSHKTGLASRTKVTGTIPDNRAAGQALADGITNFAASFGKGKGSSPGDNSGGTKGKGGKKGGKEPKPKKAPFSASHVRMYEYACM